jgi:predicted transcriptional regulator
MAVERISITMPEDLLRAADARAAVERRPRSWVVSEAVAAYTDPGPDDSAVAGPPAAAAGAGWLATFSDQNAYLGWKASDPPAHRVDPFRPRLAELCAALSRRKARYLLVGSAALLLLGASRAHAGVELLVHPSGKNLKRVVAALADLGSDLAVQALVPVLKIRAASVFGGTPRADLLTAVKGQVYKDLRDRASVVHVEGADVHLASIGDVVAGGVS